MIDDLCQACDGRTWLIVQVDFDASRAWVERCDECQWHGEDDPENKYDEDVAPVAAAYFGTTVGRAVPHGCDHEHPYLVDNERVLAEYA